MKRTCISISLAALLVVLHIALAHTVNAQKAAPRTIRRPAPVAPGATKTLVATPMNTELPAPVILNVTPTEVTTKNALVTVQGQNFGANQSGGRRIILTQKEGGMQVLPPVESWKNNRITLKAPDLSGLYLIQVDNASSKPVSNGVEIMLGVEQKDIRVDFAPVFGGTRLDNMSISYFYLGPAGGAPNTWRAIHTTQLLDFPRLLNGGKEQKVVSKGWNQKKNTMYDISIRCYLRLKSPSSQISFDSNNYLVFSIPYTADIYQTATIFWYNTQDADGHDVKDQLLTKPMQGMLTIRVPLTLQNVGKTKKILSAKADVTFNGEFVIKNLWPETPLETLLQREWATAKNVLGTAIAEKFAKSDYRMSIFANEFSPQVQSLVGPGATILRFETKDPHTLRVHYID
jgi:hypothetical protein